MVDLLFNWSEMHDLTLLELKRGLVLKLIIQAKEKAGNLNRVCLKTGLTYPSLYNFINGKHKLISVYKLKKILTFLDLPYEFVNDEISEVRKGAIPSIISPKFPIDLTTREGAYLIGNILSDGTVYKDKKSRNVLRTKYSSSDPEQITFFLNNLNQIYGQIHHISEINGKNVYLKIGTTVVGESLRKVGVPVGNKTTLNYNLPVFLFDSENDVKISYLRAIYSDEGSVGHPLPEIVLTRCKHINNDLTKEENDLLESKFVPLMKVRIISTTGHVLRSISFPKLNKLFPDNSLLNKIKQIAVPKLLSDESRLLSSLGIETRIYITTLSKTTLGRYTVSATMKISKKESIINFANNVGFELTRKQDRLLARLTEMGWK